MMRLVVCADSGPAERLKPTNSGLKASYRLMAYGVSSASTG